MDLLYALSLLPAGLSLSDIKYLYFTENFDRIDLGYIEELESWTYFKWR